MTSLQAGRDLYAAQHPNGQTEAEDDSERTPAAGSLAAGRAAYAKFHPKPSNNEK